jgi:hypothetical protein
MPNEVDSYKIGAIRVSITENEKNNKLTVDCNDGNFHSAFTVRRYEYENYKRHMNQRIKNAYNQQYDED